VPEPCSAYRPIAVVGLHGRMPGAADLRGFWDNLVEGRDAITLVPNERWRWEEIFGEPVEGIDRTYANRGGFIPFADRFDHHFFNILPREAQTMDPQQRLFLQTAWAAFEDAGYAPGGLAGRKIGVFAGVGYADYPVLMRRDGVPLDIYRATGMAQTAIANRVSFTFDFHGPSESIDTACSSSLVAIHRAVQSLHRGECEMALAGGINLLLGPELFIAFAKAGMLSRSGHCRTFDAAADGYVRGEGVGALVLRPLEDAELRGDFIYGVIRGSAENHGGRAHSFTAPNVDAQAGVVSEAWRYAGVSPAHAALIETHGTGTPLGDPIEINALKKVLENAPDRATGGSIALGALKSHIGHLEAAAGIAGMIKALLAMQHKILPANLHHERLNPYIEFDGAPFAVPTQNLPLTATAYAEGEPAALLAGVSSFGFGGVNAHIVLQSYDRRTSSPDAPEAQPYPHLVVLSAKDGPGLLGRVRQMIGFLDEPSAQARQAMEAAVLHALYAALEVAPPVASAAQVTPLTSLRISPAVFAAAVGSLTPALGREADLASLRDCVTVEEAAQALASHARLPEVPGAPDLLLCGVALPGQQARAATLAQLAYTLMEGRDALRERLAVVARSKAELLDHLLRFIARPDDRDLAWIRGSARASAAERPGSPADEAGRLRALGVHWVETRNAVLLWDEIHPGVPAPGRIPLPAYPFRLDRVWYEQGARLGAGAQPSLTQALPDLWRSCWESAAFEAPGPMAALAVLAEHLAASGDARPQLADVVFGRPWPMPPEAVLSSRVADGVGQCVLETPNPRVLLQARVLGSGAQRFSAAAPRRPFEVLDGAAFEAGMARDGLIIASAFRSMKRLEAAPGVLVIHVALSRRPTAAGLFWTCFLAAMLAGLNHLHKSGGTPGRLLLPFSLSAFGFDPRAAGDIRRIVLSRDDASGTTGVLGLDGNGAIAVFMEGLRLRSAPSAAVDAMQPVTRRQGRPS
jgi:3-oxoacyl-(acyl-carrier-protein) synthase